MFVVLLLPILLLPYGRHVRQAIEHYSSVLWDDDDDNILCTTLSPLYILTLPFPNLINQIFISDGKSDMTNEKVRRKR